MAYHLRKRKTIPPMLDDLSDEELEDEIKELCFELMYRTLFSRKNPKDDQIQEKMFVLQNIITPRMLSIKDKHYAYNIYQMGYNELRKINSVKSPLQKCKVIFQSINCLSSLFEESMPTADELFPIIVYMIMCANPPNFQTNIDFIQKFLPHDRKMNKEGFVITNILAAIEFLEKMDGTALLEGKV